MRLVKGIVGHLKRKAAQGSNIDCDLDLIDETVCDISSRLALHIP
jgi:hypothetical protein